MTEKNFGRDGLGCLLLERELQQDSDVIFGLLLKLKERGLESAASEYEFYGVTEDDSSERDERAKHGI